MRFPTWKEVESDPEFQSLEPTKKKEYFGKWSKTAVDRAMQQGLYRDNDFASGFTGWYNQKAKEYGEEEEFGDFQQLSTRLRQPPKVGTSILGEITQIPSAFKSAIDQPIEAFGETAEVLGAPALAQTLKGAVEAPKDYKTAAESFMRPEKGEFEVAGFAPQYLPRAIVEQAGQLAGAVATRAIGAVVGAPLGPAGIAVGAFTGPAVFEMAQIVGPVARERAKNNGRVEPNNEDLAWAWTTAGTSGALNAIGAKYIPGGEKLVGGISKKIAASILGEGLTESGQALAQQTGETILTEKGLTVSPKEAIAEGIIGGAAGGVATAIFERADKKPEDPTKAAATKAAANQLAEANKMALELSANNAPITAKVIQDQAAKDFSAIAETEEAVEEGARFAPPEDAITKQELKTQYAALSPEDLADTEATFRERLDDEDPEMRTFAQNALDAIAEVRAEQERARKLPTDVLPTETPGATYGREADIYDVFADIRRRPMPPSGPAFESAQVIEEAARRADILRRTPEGRELLRRELQGEEMVGGVRRATEEALATAPEPAEGDVFAEIRRPSRAEEAAITIEQQLAEDERIRRSQLGAEALREELAQAESLSRVAGNTATDEEVVRLARQGLVNIQDGQNVITPRGEEVMQRGGAPLPRLTPEERAAEVVAAPAPVAIVEQAPTPTQVTPAPTPVTTPPVTPTPEAAVAPVEPVVAAEGAVEPAVIEVAPETVQAAEQKATEDFAQDLYGQEPYINHLRRVSEQMPNNKLKTAAFLHDSVEDGKMTLDEVRSQFGDDVAGLVDVVSRKEGETYAQFIDRVAQNPEAAQIKLVDLRENIRNVENFKPSLRSRYEKAIAVLEPVVAQAAPPPSAPAEAAPVGIAVGNRVKTKTTPQSFVVEEVLPQSAREAELKEQYYSIRNERTGEVQTVEAGDIKIVRGKGVRKMAAAPAISQIWATPPQEISSAATSINQRQMPATFRRVKWQSGTRNADIGGGRFDNATEYLAESGVENVIYDPYNRTQESNQAAVAKISGGQSDTATVNNVLNVIAEPESRDLVIRQAADAIKPNGKAYFLIYEGNKKGVGSPTASGWQENRKTEAYVSEIRKHFGSVIRKGNLIVAENPLKPAIVLRQVAEIRAEEKYTPVPEANRYTFREASGRAIRFFGGEKPGNFVIVNNSTDPDYEFKAGYDPETGEIILNRAYIQRGENIEDILTHELGHYIYSDPQFQADFQDFLESMPDEARAEIDRIVNEGYNKETNEVQIEEREVMAFTSLIRRTKRGLPAWEKLKDTIKKIINRFLGTNITLSDQGAMAVFNVGYKRFKSGERIIREMKEGTLRTAPEGMTQMDRDYLAAVERGDMETAQKMVDEAAKAAGYNVGPVFHGSKTAHTVFDESKIRPSPDTQNTGFFFGDEKTGRIFGNYDPSRVTRRFFIRLENPISRKTSQDIWNKIEDWPDHGQLELRRQSMAAGYDGAIEGDTFIVFSASQIKSADPVTYDDAGNVIPLSQRFQPTQRDIRRMAPEPAPAPEAVVEEAPTERVTRRTKMQNIIDISTGVKRPKTKLTVNEMTALKDQIKMRARRRREDKRSQREFAEELTKEIREMTIRGKVRPAQLRVIMSKALRTQFDNEASINGFTRYVDKVIENANYEKDLSSARAAIKEAQRLAKQKTTPGNISRYLSGFTAIDPRDIEPDDMSEREVEVDGEIVREKPVSLAEFSAVLREYMKAAGPVEAKDYTVIPDTEIADFLSKLGEQVKKNQEDQEKAAFAKRLEKALENKALLPAELDAVLNNSAKEYEDYLAKKQEDRRKKVENAINSLAEEAQIALAKYDNPEMDDNEKSILDFMKRVTLSDMSIGNRKNYIRIANNILVNNKFFGSEKFSSIAKGQIGALEASQDSKKIKRNSALIKAYNLIFRENLGPEISLGMQSFADTMRNITRPEEGVRLLYQMGFGDLERGRAASNEAKRKFTEAVEPNFKRIEEKTGQKINDSQGLVSSGVAATLIQIHPDETEAEGIQRMRGLIESDIERKKNSWKKEDRKTAILVEKALNEVYADSIEGILQNLKNTHPANYEVLTFLMNTVLPSYKPLFKKHDEMFNNQSDNYENPYYLPIRYRRISTEPVDPSEGIGNRMEGVASPKQSPNSIKRVKNSALPENMQFDYNLVKNVIDSVSSQLDATYMNPGLQQVHSFLTSEYATKALGGAENVEVVRKRINSLVESRDRRAYDMTGWSRVFDTFANGLRNVGTTMLLGGIGQLPKQVPAQMLGTVINVNDKDITSTAVFETKAALPVLRQFSIGERGEIAGGARWISQLDTGYSKLERYIEDGVWSKIKDAMENLANVWLYGLKKGDSFAAAHGWISYYKKYLKDNDMPFTNWDNEARLVAEGDRGRVQAGLYADTQVDLYQGASDPTKMATFAQRGKTGAENMMKTIFLPFSSFAIQERTRFLTDLRDVLYGDAEEKKKATKGLMATISGIVTFHWVRRYALPAMFGYLAYGLYGLLGVEMDEPDEEEEKEKDARTFRKFLGEIAANITVGGYSSIAENALIDSVNYMAYQYDKLNETENALNDDGDVISWDKYRKERAPFYRYTGPGADVSLGMVGVIPDQLKSVQEKLANLSDEELMDSLTDEEKRVLILAGISDILYSLRLNDADVARMMNRMSDEIKKQAEERKKAQRRLQRLYGQ